MSLEHNPIREPFSSLYNQGLILGPDGVKMSKSKGNVINPDDVIEEYGVDCLRMYEMFMGPFEDNKPWSTSSIKGVYRFLEKVWNLIERVSTDKKLIGSNKDTANRLNQLIASIDGKIANLQYNTCVSDFMKFLNDCGQDIFQDDLKTFLKLLFPFAPIISTEGLDRLGEKDFLDRYYNNENVWPKFNPELILDTRTKIKVMINNKFRAELDADDQTNQDELMEKARQDPAINKWLPTQISKITYIPGKVLNIT